MLVSNRMPNCKFIDDYRSQSEIQNVRPLRLLADLILSPGLMACLIFRIQSWAWDRRLRLIAKFLRAFNHFVTGADFVNGCKIEGGLNLQHPNGIVVGGTTVIGRECRLLHQVTFGQASIGPSENPTIGNNVFIGAGAKLLGGITVGDNSVIGANSVVLDDVAANTTVVGTPARAT